MSFKTIVQHHFRDTLRLLHQAEGDALEAIGRAPGDLRSQLEAQATNLRQDKTLRQGHCEALRHFESQVEGASSPISFVSANAHIDLRDIEAILAQSPRHQTGLERDALMNWLQARLRKLSQWQNLAASMAPITIMDTIRLAKLDLRTIRTLQTAMAQWIDHITQRRDSLQDGESTAAHIRHQCALLRRPHAESHHGLHRLHGLEGKLHAAITDTRASMDILQGPGLDPSTIAHVLGHHRYRWDHVPIETFLKLTPTMGFEQRAQIAVDADLAVLRAHPNGETLTQSLLRLLEHMVEHGAEAHKALQVHTKSLLGRVETARRELATLTRIISQESRLALPPKVQIRLHVQHTKRQKALDMAQEALVEAPEPDPIHEALLDKLNRTKTSWWTLRRQTQDPAQTPLPQPISHKTEPIERPRTILTRRRRAWAKEDS
mgnify:CR=1 FL=1